MKCSDDGITKELFRIYCAEIVQILGQVPMPHSANRLALSGNMGVYSTRMAINKIL
jgi:hypothetical protein